MIVTAKARYKGGRLIFYDTPEIPEDGTEVIVNFEKHPPKSVSSLRGSWTKYFPSALDIDEQLHRFRKEWEQEIEELKKFEI